MLKFISKLSANEKKIFNISAFFVVLTLLDRMFYGPVTNRSKALEREIQAQEEGIKRDMRFLAYKNRILDEIETFKPYFTETVESDEKIIAIFLKEIERLATRANVSVVKVSPSEEMRKRDYLRYEAQLECFGKLEDVVKFMYLIDDSDSLLKVVDFSLSPKKTGPREINAVLTITKMIVPSAAS